MQNETAPQTQDRQSIARVTQGDQAAFSALYDRLVGPLYSLAMRMLGDASEAEDALPGSIFEDLASRFQLRFDEKQCL